MKLYRELADWWPLFSAPVHYAEEAAIYDRHLGDAQTVLELGSGGGNNASFLKKNRRLTLSDVSEDMLRVSRELNPECEHVQGDMRHLRLGRQFDAVFVHDAVMYLTSEEDLRLAFRTAFVHTAPGGLALFVPDCVTESFRESFEADGDDGDGRSLRYLEWSYDPDPGDTWGVADYAILLREGSKEARLVHDTHRFGIFPRQSWLDWLRDAGFEVSTAPDDIEHEVFLARRPG